MDIQQFLLQRINEDIKFLVEGWGSIDRIATVKSTPKTGIWFYTVAKESGDELIANGTTVENPTNARIIFDPRKTLGLLEAQKQLVYTYVTACDIAGIAITFGMPFAKSLDERRKLLETSVKRFAAVYSEHPDYNQKWAINE